MNNSCGKNWIDILSALLTPTIAIAGIAIGFLQWRINRIRLTHELFPRRIELFNKITTYIANIRCKGIVKEGDEVQFLRDTKSICFIFDNEIKKYVDEIYNKSIDLQDLYKTNENIEKQQELKEWFRKKLNCIEKKFDKYLSLNT